MRERNSILFQELVSQRSDQVGPSSTDNSTSQTTSSLTQSSSPARKKEELKEKLALLNSRYVSKGEKQEKQDLEDRAAGQEEAALLSEEVTPTNDMGGILRLDPVTNRLTLEQEHKLASTPASPKA